MEETRMLKKENHLCLVMVVDVVADAASANIHNKEDHAEVTLGILIKIPHKNPLDLSPILFGRIKMFSKFIFLCLQNMVSVQQEEYIILPHHSHPHPS